MTKSNKPANTPELEPSFKATEPEEKDSYNFVKSTPIEQDYLRALVDAYYILRSLQNICESSGNDATAGMAVLIEPKNRSCNNWQQQHVEEKHVT